MMTTSDLIATKPTSTKPATNGHPPTISRLNLRRKNSLVAGAFYLLTFISIPTLALYAGVHDPSFIVGPGPDTGVLFGGILEIIVALAGIGTAVALYPVVKRQSEGRALGFVASRVVEGSAIFVGVACLLTLVTLRQAGVGPDALITGRALVAMYDRMFLVGQSLMPGVNALLLGSLLFQSRLVPRVLPVIGLIGAPLLVGGDIAVLFGLIDRTSSPAAHRNSDRALGVFSGCLAGCQRLQALSDPLQRYARGGVRALTRSPASAGLRPVLVILSQRQPFVATACSVCPARPKTSTVSRMSVHADHTDPSGEIAMFV